MSRYLKDVSAINYRNKKFYAVAGTYSVTIPAATKQVKTIVFGGGGNSCTTTICSCKTQLQQCCCCCFVRGHFSGAGGGFTEKIWYGVGGQSACVVVGGAEGTSSVCFCNFGSISATGGTGSGTTTRTTTPGSGTGGDINRCGSNGHARCTVGFFRFDCCGFMCCPDNGNNQNPANRPAWTCCVMCSKYYCELRGVHLPGGTPGDTLCNRVAFSDDTNSILNFCCGTNSYFTYDNGGDGPSVQFQYCCPNQTVNVTNQDTQMLSCSFCTVPGQCWAFPTWYCQNTFPVGIQSCIDPNYSFDWDTIGNCCCTCCRPTCNPSCYSTGCRVGYCYCRLGGNCPAQQGEDPYTNFWCTFGLMCFVNRNNESCLSTALGASGFGCAAGTVGGGGAGIWNGDQVRCQTDYSRSGGNGLVVVFY
jgi:hypothetical protein